MNKFLALLMSTSSLAGTAVAGTFYYDEPSGKAPIAPPPTDPIEMVSTCASDYFDYDFLDIEYNFTSFDDDFLDDANGISVGFSKTLTDFTFVTLGGLWEPVDATDGEDDVDFWSFSAGAGMVFPISDRVHLVAEGGLFYGFETGSDDDNGSLGGYVGPTLRVGLTRAIEGFASVNYIVDDETDQFEYSAGTVLRITRALGLRAEWSWNDDEQTVGIGVRLAF